MDGNRIYAFDPYYRKNPFKEKSIRMIDNAPKKMNRKITYKILNAEGNGNYVRKFAIRNII